MRIHALVFMKQSKLFVCLFVIVYEHEYYVMY